MPANDPADIQPISLDDLKKSHRAARSVPLVILVGATIAVAFTLTATPLQSANDRSRWATVYSLGDRGVWHIDEIDAVPGWSTIDKVRHEGHFYSSKPALLPAIATGLYKGVQLVTGWNIRSDTAEVTRTILLLLNVIPMVIAWFLLHGILERYAEGRYTKRLLLIAAVFATPLTSFLTTFNNHTVAAWAIVFALTPALRILIDDRRSAWLFAASGFFAAFACTNELPALSFLGLLGLFLLKRDPRRTLLVFAPAALVPLLLSVGMTYWQTGGWKPFYAGYGSELYEYVHQGIPSYWMNPRGFDKNADAFPVYLLHCTFGHHGIFSLTPLFLLMLVPWVAPRLTREKLRPVVWMTAILTLVVLGFYLSRTQNYNYGGNSSYLRWLIWLVPLWILALIPVLDRCGERRSMQIVAGLFLMVGTFSTFWSIANPWTATWMFSLLDRYGLVEQYQDPLEPFPAHRHAWFASLPDATPEEAEPDAIELTGVDPTGRRLVLALRDGGDAGDGLRKIVLSENLSSRELVAHEAVLDAAAFRAGQPLEKVVVSPEPGSAEHTATLALLRGLPAPRRYNPGRTRYIQTDLRDDYLTCQLGASEVRHKDPATGQTHIYRSDVWYCDDLPFGVAQVNFSVRVPGASDRVADVVLKVTTVSRIGQPDRENK